MKTLILILFSVSSFASEKTDFLDKMGLSEGTYELTSGPSTCQSGTLKVLDVDKELSLMLGARTLATNVTKKEFSEKERDCTFTNKNDLSPKKLLSSSIEKCNSTESRYSIEIKVQDEKTFEYTRTVFQKNKKIKEEICKLKLATK